MQGSPRPARWFHDLLAEAPPDVLTESTSQLIAETAVLLAIADILEDRPHSTTEDLRRLAHEMTGIERGQVDPMLALYPRSNDPTARGHRDPAWLTDDAITPFLDVLATHGISPEASLGQGLLAEGLRFSTTRGPLLAYLASKGHEHRSAAQNPTLPNAASTFAHETEAHRLEAEREWVAYLVHKLFLGRLVHRHHLEVTRANDMLDALARVQADSIPPEALYLAIPANAP